MLRGVRAELHHMMGFYKDVCKLRLCKVTCKLRDNSFIMPDVVDALTERV
jgi:hypothetical protein